MTKRVAFLFSTCVLLLTPTLFAQEKLANENLPLVSVDRWKQALAGYDPVAYFDFGEPTPGERQFYSSYNGVYYTFATKVTRERFLKDPDRFLPQFGGYCALSLALSEDEVPGRAPGLYASDPKLFYISGDKLYMFSTGFDFDPVERWKAHEEEYASRADARWKQIVESKR